MAFPSLKNIPWRIFTVNDVQYMVKYKIESGYSVMVAEGSSLFYEELNSRDVMVRCKQLNPKFEITKENLMETLNVVLTNFNEMETLSIQKEENELSIKMKSSVVNIILQWHFKLQMQPPPIVYIELILPLLGIIQKLIQEKAHLIKIIKKKDAEIADYKNNGAKVSLPILETPVFSEEDFEALQSRPEVLSMNFKENLLLDVYGSNLFTLMHSAGLISLDAKTEAVKADKAEVVKKEKEPLEQQKDEEYFPHIPNKEQGKKRKFLR